jgi:hypothetical protein
VAPCEISLGASLRDDQRTWTVTVPPVPTDGRDPCTSPPGRRLGADRHQYPVHRDPLDPAADRRVELVNGSAAKPLTPAVRGGPAEITRVVHAPDGRMIESTSAR